MPEFTKTELSCEHFTIYDIHWRQHHQLKQQQQQPQQKKNVHSIWFVVLYSHTARAFKFQLFNFQTEWRDERRIKKNEMNSFNEHSERRFSCITNIYEYVIKLTEWDDYYFINEHGFQI